MPVTSRLSSLLSASLVFISIGACSGALLAQSNISANYARDPRQPIDQSYTESIKKYTTEPYFNSPLTDYLPASKTVPTPAKVLGDVSGAPGILPYAEDVYKYFRLLEKSTPRVKVFSIGHSEEGREMIAAAIGDESLLAKLSENDARLAKLADPRTINMDDAKAAELVKQSFPVYYITGTIHSTETGAPTALMELAYRLAVDDSPYIQYIRSHMVILITPVVEVDGRDRMVDIYKWHLAHPGQQWPRLMYWGHYVAHDNNRDAMAMTLNLTRNVLDTNLKFHAQVLHDLHESVPFLYDNTVGDGPYNAWVDPLLNGEWQMLGWNNIQQMTALGMPGVFTHGDFDTWSPGYLMFLATMHNGISRLYETFGNGGADTEKRILTPDEYARTWYKPNPPLPVVTWSQRNNNNYEQTALLSTISFFAQNSQEFLSNYYTKSKRSILKPESAGPAAYVLDEPTSSRQAELLRTLALQHVEISRLSEPFTFTPPAKPKAPGSDNIDPGKPEKDAAPKPITLPAGSYLVRMDQPYSRIADALLDRQYWAPDDPQKTPYDDTGWSFGDLFHVKTVRVTDNAILKVKMEKVAAPGADFGKVTGSGNIYAVNNSAEVALLGLRYTFKDATISVADQPFDAEGHHFEAGSLLIQNADAAKLKSALADAGLDATTLASMPSTATHVAPTPRIAFMHTWLSTQTEGWWREAFDHEHIPYDYISTQTVAQTANLRSKYDVIIFAPVGRASTQQIINGMPMWGNALPWEKTDLTPNLTIDSTPDMRPGLTYTGVDHLKGFVSKGGLLIASEDTAQFAIDLGLAPGVFTAPRGNVRITGSILQALFVDKSSPIVNGYDTKSDSGLGVYSADGMAFTIANTTTSSGNRRGIDTNPKRPTGRGGPTDEDTPEDRPYVAAELRPTPKPWEAMPLNEEEARNNVFLIPEQYRPQVILRFTAAKQLLLSGLLDGATSIEEKPVVVNAHFGEGNVLLFANNPVYRGETLGSYALVFNAIMNYDHLARK
jgi:Zinc carboxypeptidase